MRRFVTALAVSLALALPMGGCSQISTLFGGGSVAQAAPQTIADAEKGLTIAHLAYQGLGITLQQAAASGVLHGSAAATAKTYYDQAGGYLDTADAADAAANAQGIFSAVASAEAAIAQAKALIPSTGH